MMRLKNILPVVSFVSLILLTSCGGTKNETTDTKKNDSAVAKTPEELKKLNTALLADPNSADLLQQRAKYYYNTKDFAAGLTDMEKAVKIDSSKADYFLTLSDLYFVTNKTGLSKTALEKCISLDSKNVDAILKLAELYLYVGKNDKSIEYVNMALKIDQYNSKAYFMKGMNYKELKDTARAISSMQTAVEQDQEYYIAFMQLGILCAAKKNPLAEQYYKNALKIQPKSVEAWYDLGKYYQDKEDFTEALETYKGLTSFNNNKNAHYNMGVIYLINLKTPKIALDHFSEAIKIDQNYFEAYYSRGICYQTLGDKKNALVDFQSALAISPNYEPAQTAIKQLK